MKKSKINKINSFNILAVDIQIIFTVLSIILAIVSLFNNSFFRIFKLSLGFSLLIMGYNNQKIFKRKNTTILYVIAGVILVIVGCLGV